MLAKILQLELVLKGVAGVLLLTIPVTTARVLGLPHGNVGFWARLLGILLIGIAGAVYLEHDVEGAEGLGLGGLILINVLGVLTLTAMMLLHGAGSRRGAIATWLVIATLFGLALAEILQL